MINTKNLLVAAFAGGLLLSGVTVASAETEKEVLKKCELSLCELIVKKSADGGPIACNLVKTWGKKDLEKGAKAGKLSWKWGDAQCKTNISIARAPLIEALTADKYDLKLDPTPVTCTIGGGEKSEVKFTLAPTLSFEKGEAKKARLGLDNIEGSFMKRMALKTAQLVDKSHILDSVIAKEVNKFISKNCPAQIK